MTREELERYLDEGLSLAEIGKRVGRTESTVSYHLKKHGLRPVGIKHAPKEPLSKETLVAMRAEGLSLTEMAGRLSRHETTVRRWLDRYGLWPLPASARREEAQAARAQGLRYAELECKHHGRTTFILENRGYYRCTKCRVEQVSEWRREAKRRLIERAGGACQICGYDRYPGALQFHHLDPAEKEFSISREGVTRRFSELEAEADKCVLLCANCHAEVEVGYSQPPLDRRVA